MAKKDAILVLANTFIPHRRLSPETVSRVDKAAELYHKGAAKFMIMQGGPGAQLEGNWADRSTASTATWVPRGTRPVISDVMKAYAVTLGVPEERIFVQPYSCDNVGEAIFGYGMFLRPEELDFTDNIIVTPNHNISRASKIYRKLIPSRHTFDFEGVDSPLDTDEITLETEKKNLAVFLKQFAGVTPGDLESMLNILYKEHPYYNWISEEHQLRF